MYSYFVQIALRREIRCHRVARYLNTTQATALFPLNTNKGYGGICAYRSEQSSAPVVPMPPTKTSISPLAWANYLRVSGLVMSKNIATVIKLIGHVTFLLAFTRKFLGSPNSTVSAFFCWREHKLGTKSNKDWLPLGAHAFWHKKLNLVSFCRSYHC
jgi:hypothetical protein